MTDINRKLGKLFALVLFIGMFLPLPLTAQRMGHRPAGGRGGSSISRPSGSSMSRPSNYNVSRPDGRTPSRSINGGSQRPATREVGKPTGAGGSRGVLPDKGTENKGGSTNIKNSVDKSSGNKPNIDKSNKNVMVKNTRNVVVRPAPRPYPKPPFTYGGYRYNCYHPYHYHPYHPFYWGPAFHPFGFFVASMAVTAMIITVANQKYYYDQGVYYVASNGGYTVVEAPVGASVPQLPPGSQTVVVNETTNNYYYGGTYYEKTGDNYSVVPPTAGTVVENLPDGGKEVKISNVTYVQVGDTYYQPMEQDGKSMYEVVDVQVDVK